MASTAKCTREADGTTTASPWPPGRIATELPLRIALSSGNYNCVTDGANRALNRLVRYALDAGHAVRVYSPVTPVPAFAPEGDLVAVPSVAIPRRPEYRFALGLPARVADDVARFAPDLVHVSAPDPLGAGAQKLARQLGVPLVASMHTRFETYFGYYGLGAAKPLAERWLRTFYGRCDRVLVPNGAMADALARLGVATATARWSRGVDTGQFSPARRDERWRAAHGIGEDDVALLFFGRLVPEKGLAIFAKVCVEARRLGLPVRPLVVGDGPGRERLRAQLPDAVFTGYLEGAALGRAVASADVFLNPSVTEAFGNVTLEAMSAGVVTVAADVPVSRNLITDGVDGLLEEPDDPLAMLGAVRQLALDPTLRRRLSAQAMVTASHHSWPATLSAVLRTYRELVDAGRASYDGATRDVFADWIASTS